MRYQSSTSVLILASAFALAATQVSGAQQAPKSIQTDPRWYAWLGCWAPDTSSGVSRKASSNVTCVVPVANSRAVDALTIAHGAIVSRDRLDAGGGAHAINGQGCKGSETVNWSATGHRVFLHADYACAGDTQGTSTTVFALVPSGEWLRLEQVRSGGGAIVSTTRLHEVAIPAAVSPEVARSIEQQERAVTMARAAAAAPIGTDEIIDALHSVDAGLVRAWLAETRQHFALDGQQVAALTNGDVPASVLQAMIGASPQDQTGASLERTRNVDAYLNTPPYGPAFGSPVYQEMMTMRTCPPNMCFGDAYSTYNPQPYYPSAYNPAAVYPYAYSPYLYSMPVILRGGTSRDGHREPARPHQPVLPGPVGIGRRPR